MRTFTYARPRNLADVSSALRNGARIIAGGTTLYDLMKLDIEQPSDLLDITELDDLSEIKVDRSGVTIGALARMSDVAAHDGIAKGYPMLAESLLKAASQQLRNMATVGGNLLQRTRCPYFRNGSHYPCNKRTPGSGCAAIGGLDRGHALFGGSEACIAVYPGDWAVALTALDGTVDITGPQGKRSLSVAELLRLPGDTPHLENALQPGEMITHIRVPPAPWARASTYHKIRDRESYAFALVSAAVAVDLKDGQIRNARVALGGVGTKPWRAVSAEAFLSGRPLDRNTAQEAGRLAFAEAKPGHHNGFKIELGARVVADALMISAERGSAA